MSCPDVLLHKDTRIRIGFGLDLFSMHPLDSSHGVQGLLSVQPLSILLAKSLGMKRGVSMARTGVF